MQRGRIEIVKAVLTSKYWLLLSLSTVFLTFFAFYSGGTDTFIKISGCIVMIELLVGNYSIKKIPAWHLVTAVICIYLLLTSVLTPFGDSPPRQMFRLVRMLIMVFAIHCLSQKEIDKRVIVFVCAILVLSVCWQFAARNLLSMPYGTYDNRHKLTNFTVFVLPVIFYFLLIAPKWYKFIFLLVGVLDFTLIVQVGSFPAYVAIFLGVLFASFFFSKGWYKWLGITLTLTAITILYVTDYGIARDNTGAIITLKDLIFDISKDERIHLWKGAWKMLQDNSIFAWFVGHGIGSGRAVFPKYTTYHFVYPHSYFLEILYDNGIIGFVLIFGGLGFLFFSAMRRAKTIVDERVSIFLKCMVTLFLAWFSFIALVFPLYSNYSLYPLGFILGILLVLMERIPVDVAIERDTES